MDRYIVNHKIKIFKCLDQFDCMAFAQLTYWERLRDIEACLRVQRSKLYHMGKFPQSQGGNQIAYAVGLAWKHSNVHPYAKIGKTSNFLTNNFVIPAITVADLYFYRWQVELFFKWIKQYLRIKSFVGTSENVVKTQVWIAISVYVFVEIIKQRLNLEAVLYTILKILRVIIFERMTLNQMVAKNYWGTSDEIY